MSERGTHGGARPGAGRPIGPDGRSVRVGIRLPERLLARLDARAASDGMSRSASIVEALRAYLEMPATKRGVG